MDTPEGMVKKKIRKDTTGKEYGHLVVKGYAGHIGKDKYVWCLCECGRLKPIRQRCLGKRLGNMTCGECSVRIGSKHPEYEGVGDLSKNVWNTIRHSAAARNIPFNITIEYAWSLFEAQDGRCALTGREILFNKSYKTQKSRTASLDRIDSRLGYEVGNMQWVHRLVNRVKVNLHNEEFVALCQEVADYAARSRA
jgi:hypothetical protein